MISRLFFVGSLQIFIKFLNYPFFFKKYLKKRHFKYKKTILVRLKNFKNLNFSEVENPVPLTRRTILSDKLLGSNNLFCGFIFKLKVMIVLKVKNILTSLIFYNNIIIL